MIQMGQMACDIASNNNIIHEGIKHTQCHKHLERGQNHMLSKKCDKWLEIFFLLKKILLQCFERKWFYEI